MSIFDIQRRNQMRLLDWKAEQLDAQIHGERVAFELFKAVSPQQPFRILPFGKWYRGNRVLDITDDRLRQMEANFNAGLPRYGVSINVEHGEEKTQPGKVGRVKQVAHKPGDGVYVTEADWTGSGKRLVEEGRYSGVSPELVWTLYNDAKYQDPKTGAWHDNVLVGLALTDTPFFGQDVATFSCEVRRVALEIKGLELDRELMAARGDPIGVFNRPMAALMGGRIQTLPEADQKLFKTVAQVSGLTDTQIAAVLSGELASLPDEVLSMAKDFMRCVIKRNFRDN